MGRHTANNKKGSDPVVVKLHSRSDPFFLNKIMLSMDLAELYRVPVKRLNEQVKRNIKRFPDDFMFQLNEEEYKILKSQIATSRWGGARRANPYAFTEQ